MDKPIRILHIIGGMYYGGKESLLMNIYSQIDRTKIQFDFMIHSNIENELEFHKKIKEMGGKVYYINKISEVGVFKYVRSVKNIIITNGPYYAVHTHMKHQSGLNALSARLAEVKIRISHVHSTDVGTNKNKMFLPFYRLLMNWQSTKNIACSVKAGQYFFFKNNFKVINNGIEVDKFVYQDIISINAMKRNLGINNEAKIIGHVGRFIRVKNHEFLINVFKEMGKYEEYVLVLVGDGPDLNKIKKLCYDLNIQDKVYFLGTRKDIHEIISILDLFLFPSFNEGLGTVLIEAQASGIPCIASDTLPRDSDLGLNLIKYCSIDSISKWIKCVDAINYSDKVQKSEIEMALKIKGFDSETTLNEFLKLYEIY